MSVESMLCWSGALANGVILCPRAISPLFAAEPAAQQPLVDEIYEKLRPHAEDTMRSALHKLLASKKPRELLGKTEYELRDLVHELGAKATEVGIESTVKKGATRELA